jgi:uncharacterized protein involved in exopolysaccharide biosynthesis
MSAQSLPPLLSLSMVWRGKWLILGCVTVSIASAFAYLHVAKPVFQAEARLMVRQKGLQLDAEKGFLKDRQFLATEAKLIRSEPNLRRTLQTVHPELPEGCSLDPLTYMLEALTVTPSPVADVLTIRYRGAEQDNAVAIVRAMIDSYLTMARENEGDVYDSTIGVLAEREGKLRVELAELHSEYECIRR